MGRASAAGASPTFIGWEDRLNLDYDDNAAQLWRRRRSEPRYLIGIQLGDDLPPIAVVE